MMKKNEKIAYIRESLNLTQSELAAFLDVTQPMISAVEKGTRKLNVSQLERLASLCGNDISIFDDNIEEFGQIKFAFRADSVTIEDLKAIADIGLIVSNCKFMAELLGDEYDG